MRAPFGTWPSPISAGLAAAGAVRIAGVQVDGDDVYWVASRPADKGRSVVVRRRADGVIADVTPAGFNVRSRVHEYGGGAFTVARGAVYFSNDADQRLWRQDPGAAPVPLTPEGPFRHADAVVDHVRGRLICVREEHRPGAAEPINTIVAVPLAGGAPEVLVEGADFYASPCLAPDGGALAYLRWRHPFMPWQSTELCLAPLGPDGRPGAARVVAGGADEAVVVPQFAPDGALWFAADRTGFWNLYRARGAAIEPVYPLPAEFGPPLWVFGLSSYAFLADGRVACAFQRDGTWHLGRLAPDGAFQLVDTSLTDLAYVRAAGARAVFAGASAVEPIGIHALEPDGRVTLLHRAGASAVDAAVLSRPEPITFTTDAGATAHGLHYPPCNPGYQDLPGERPPLVVMSHGGPTAAASTGFNLALQFWTSRGFAVLDVNYRGSTGYGRAFRAALDGHWGLADVEDCIAGAHALAARGLADPQRLLIRGGSAGGYTTLAALTFHDAFRAGASHYGVSDLETLARDTHKFESRYLDSLIGPYPARRDLYVARSPIHHVARLSRPVIFFQGLQDKVVPPDQAERMVQALRDKGLPVEYVTFPDEQHGFRSADNIAAALEAELAFYRRVLGLVTT